MMKPNSLLLSAIFLCTLLFRCTEDDPEIDITDIQFDGDKVTVTEGFTYDLTTAIEVTGSDADQAEISFSSSDASVVSVSGHILTAEKVGTTTVTATEANSGLTASIEVEVIANIIAVTGVVLDESEANLKVGETLQLVATISPEDATEKDITWSVAFPSGSKSSEDEPTDIATVSETGLVTAIAAGDVVVTAKTKDGEFTASVDVSITNIAVTGVKIDNDPISIAGSTTYQLAATVEPSNATNQTVIWSLYLDQSGRIRNEEIPVPIRVPVDVDYYAEIDSGTGVITSKNPCDGCGLIAVATTFEGEFSDELPVEITYVDVTSITLDPSSITIDVEGTEQMTATILPENASNKNVTWSIDFASGFPDANPNDYASVSETGLVTGIAPETFDIVVKATAAIETDISGTASITVNPILATNIEIVDSDDIPFPEKKFVSGPNDCTLSMQLKTSIAPENVSDESVTWSIDDEETATISSEGMLDFNSTGTVRVTATTNDGTEMSDYLDVTFTGCL
ncbi:MAG: Ig-like domain-containing protein [Reichenbachiella sp.]|uniref:Ig-like domain-containing protein n=1 Tax=Reichenbachiella sp. TaxID=2184521 RepID=UPI002966F078|nr:Ig-like domain-containing protein [Reichenbachiella sp.]MDW3209669.1 Ig-like domain-containing protein [Reichenbachiella sp.]